MATFIDGIGASENIDSSGEIISIAGMDISTLDKTGIFSYEHEGAVAGSNTPPVKTPSQIIGKILKAKKIFSQDDCEDDRQRYFWSKCQVPYIYVMGELFDDYKESAKEVAGMFHYDADHQHQNEHDVVGFSIEGSYLKKEGMTVTHSIARKCTITICPCNKMAIAEMVPAKTQTSDDDIFKTEVSVEVELFKSEGSPAYQDFLKKKEDMYKSEHSEHGSSLGTTSSGKEILSHKKVHEYQGFSPKDHHEAAEMHRKASQKPGNAKLADYHWQKMKLHTQAADTAAKKQARFHSQLNAKKQNAISQAPMVKALDAGSGNVAPSQLTGGAALAKEGLVKNGEKNPSLKKIRQKGTFNQKGVHMPPLNSAAGGESVMGSHVRNPSSEGSGSKEMARRHAQVNLRDLKSMPKPNLTKTEQKPISEMHPTELQPGQSYNIGLKSGQMAKYHRSTAAAHHFSSEGETKFHKVDRTTMTKAEKTDWSSRADEAYGQWDKREQYRQFMKKRLPHLHEGEIDAIGRTLALKKSIETSLHKSEDHQAPKFIAHKDRPIHSKVKVAALAHHKKNPGSIHSVETEQDGSHWLVLNGHTVDNPGQHTWHSDNHEGVLRDIKGIRPCTCDNCKGMKKSEDLLAKALTFGTKEDQEKVAAAIAERAKNPPKKSEPKKKAPELKGPVDSEVSHVRTSVGHTPTGTHELDEVHLASGHESHGHPKGKFKVGDKVTIKPHLMGTHILEHKK